MAASLPIVTTSERSAARRCPQMWYWRYRMGLHHKYELADALWFGIGVHIALAAWYRKGYRRGPHPADTFVDYCGDEIREIAAQYATHDREWYERPKYEDALDLGTEMLTAYVDYYGRDDDWEVISVETPFKTRIIRQGQPIAYFMSTWDGVIRWRPDGRIYLIEHKTAAQIQTAYLELDDQGGIYFAVATAILRARGILGPDEEIAGIIYNFLRKAKPDTRPRNEGGAYLNKDGSVSKKQPPPMFVRPNPLERDQGEIRSQLDRLADEVTIMNGMRTGAIPIVKNTTKDCPRCEFFDLCVLHEHGSEEAYRELIASEFMQSNPYDRYTQKSASGG